MLKVKLPLKVVFPRVKVKDKILWVNLNNYHNLHPVVRNQAKQLYSGYVADSLGEDSRKRFDRGPFRATYTLFWRDNRRIDIANVLVLIDKYTMDALVSLGVFPDDSSDIFPEVTYRWGGVDKANPRAELEVTRV